MAWGTTRLLSRPIQHKSLYTLALAGALLAPVGAKRWPEYINLMQALGTGEKCGVDRATGEYMGARQHITLGYILLSGGIYDTIGGGARGVSTGAIRSGYPSSQVSLRCAL